MFDSNESNHIHAHFQTLHKHLERYVLFEEYVIINENIATVAKTV